MNSGENLQFPEKSKISEKSKNLLKKMLEIDLEKRISWEILFKEFLDIQKE